MRVVGLEVKRWPPAATTFPTSGFVEVEACGINLAPRPPRLLRVVRRNFTGKSRPTSNELLTDCPVFPNDPEARDLLS
jgi:hypothetical protein